jgi:hypothetical protein
VGTSGNLDLLRIFNNSDKERTARGNNSDYERTALLQGYGSGAKTLTMRGQPGAALLKGCSSGAKNSDNEGTDRGNSLARI